MSEGDVDKLTSKDRRGSLEEVRRRVTYLEHVRKNPTKSFSEAVSHLYEELDNLGAYVSEGVADKDLDLIRDIYSKTINRSVENDYHIELVLKVMVKKRERGEIPGNYGVSFVASPDNNKFLVLPVPKRRTQN